MEHHVRSAARNGESSTRPPVPAKAIPDYVKAKLEAQSVRGPIWQDKWPQHEAFVADIGEDTYKAFLPENTKIAQLERSMVLFALAFHEPRHFAAVEVSGLPTT